MSRILYVEDNEKIAASMMRSFRLLMPEIEVDHTDTAHKAIALLQTIKYGCVVSDYDLAEHTNGGQILQFITDEQPALKNRFILLTGNDSALSAPVVVLIKPTPPRDVVRIIDEMLTHAEVR